jgi:hypothetical protein
MPSISVLVKTFPTGLWGVLSTIIFVLGVIARLKRGTQFKVHSRHQDTNRNSSKSIFQSCPVGFLTPAVWG